MQEQTRKEYLKKFRPTIDFSLILRFITSHPGLAIFLVYGTIAIAGFIYLVTFYAYFGLDVIVYLELADILTAGIKDPTVMLMVLGAFSVVLISWWFTYLQAPFNAWLDRKFTTGIFRFIPYLIGFKSAKSFWRTALFLLGIYFFMFIGVHSKNKAELIKKERVNLIQVESDAISNSDHEFTLLGTSISYVFLYNHNEENTLIIPLENIRSLKPVMAKKIEQPNNSSTKIVE